MFDVWRAGGYETFVEIHPEDASSRQRRGNAIKQGQDGVRLGGGKERLGGERGVDDWLHMRILRAVMEAEKRTNHRLVMYTL